MSRAYRLPAVPSEPAAARLLRKKDQVIQTFMEASRAEIPASRSTSNPMLVNSLPELLQEITEQLHSQGIESPAQERAYRTQQSLAHAQNRATKTDYSLTDVLHEYRLVRRVIFDVLDENTSPTPLERDIINDVIDRRMNQSAARFVELTEEINRARARSGEALLQAYADSLPQIAFITDAKGDIDYCNRSYKSYFGRLYEERKESGVYPPAFIHPDYYEKTRQVWAECLRSGRPTEIEHRLKRGDGEYRWHFARIVPYKDAEGRISQWFGTDTDIHEQKNTEARLQRAVRARDETLAIVSHDLRNPLTTIVMLASLLARNGAVPGDPDIKATGEKLRSTAQRMNRLIEDLLGVAKQEAGIQKTSPDFRSSKAIIDEAIDAMLPLATEKNIRLTRLFRSDDAFVYCNPDELLRVLLNLIGNAIKFTPPDGYVTVSTEKCAGNRVLFSVKDTGIGIPQEELAPIFNRFYQSGTNETQRQGAGLGLSISKTIIESHRGRIWAESSPDGGSTFNFSLPARF